jgi:hypothetical protein
VDMGLYTALVSSQGRAHIASETADKQLAPLAPAIRAHCDDDHVLILEANERSQKAFIRSARLSRSMPAGSDTVAPSRPSERITRTGSSSAAGSRPRRHFFLAPRAVFASSTI